MELGKNEGFSHNALHNWTSDSRAIVVQKNVPAQDAPTAELWFVPVDPAAGPPRKLDLGVMDLVAGERFAVHPDNRQIAFLAGATEYEIRVIDRFLSPSPNRK